MKILVTGATGFLGRHIVPGLVSDGHSLALLVRAGAPRLHAGFPCELILGDLNEPDTYRSRLVETDPDICIHLAWEGIPDFSRQKSLANVSASTRLIDVLAEETRCRKLIVSGSCAEYGVAQGACREEQPVVVNSSLSWAKQAVYSYARLRCPDASLALVWFRIFYVYGPSQRAGSIIPVLERFLRGGEAHQIGKPFNKNDFIYIDDVVDAFRRAVEMPVPSGIYNLGSGKSTAVIDVCRTVEAQLTGGNLLTERLAAASGSRAQSSDFWADTRKTALAMGWRPEFSMYEGIRATLHDAGRMNGLSRILTPELPSEQAGAGAWRGRPGWPVSRRPWREVLIADGMKANAEIPPIATEGVRHETVHHWQRRIRR